MTGEFPAQMASNAENVSFWFEDVILGNEGQREKEEMDGVGRR